MNKTLKTAIAASGALALALASFAFPAFAQVNLNGSVGVTASGSGIGANVAATIKANLITKAQDRADREIARRITALNALEVRINSMQKLSSDEKSSLSSEIQGQITLMNTLQAQIASDAQGGSTSTLKTDIASITKAYRIFMLVIPQGAEEAASDRILSVSGSMATLSGQLQARITAANASGTNVTAAQSSLADMNAKVADANVQANAANTEIASLKPDNGNDTVKASNTAALKDARAKIQAGQQDLVAARKDAIDIAKDLRISLSASATASTTAQ